MSSILELKKEMDLLADERQAKLLAGFFKTGKGQYGEGDIFLGIKVPAQRKAAKKYIDLEMGEIEELLKSRVHEHRLCALLILVDKFGKEKNEDERKKIFTFYMKNTAKINNWDLVDLSAPNIVGEYLIGKNEAERTLSLLAKSKNLWEKRIAIVSTFAFIQRGEFSNTLKVSEMLLEDKHDLIHKAVGWMLREMGKRGGMKEEEEFLDEYADRMPRTMLRYAIERFEKKKKEKYMAKGKGRR